jgi:RND superfamily putative drug exporter
VSNFLFRLGRLTARHPYRTLGVWLLIGIAVFSLNSRFGGEVANDLRVPGVEAQQARDLLKERFPTQAGSAGQVVFHVFLAIPGSSPQDEATTELVNRLRSDVLPTALDGSGARALITGQTAFFEDISKKLGDRLPIFIAAVVGLSFVLLTIVFRSILVPLKAALMNLLSIGAACGVVVAIFQWGWGNGLVGLEDTIPVNPFVPLIMFAILFGLSMHYEVFLLSRIREEYVRTGDSHGSVVQGLAATARVITSAALIMISIFLAFVTSSDVMVKMFGVGLATAVFLDATLVRMVLVPSTMSLLGRANWWLPRWLHRVLPRLDLEGEASAGVTELPPRELERLSA